MALTDLCDAKKNPGLLGPGLMLPLWGMVEWLKTANLKFAKGAHTALAGSHPAAPALRPERIKTRSGDLPYSGIR
jgi:hypothetical protein